MYFIPQIAKRNIAGFIILIAIIIIDCIFPNIYDSYLKNTINHKALEFITLYDSPEFRNESFDFLLSFHTLIGTLLIGLIFL